jgi:peptidoglycan/xylan/chitin deacetylase (PgdA/CDA1 family)/lipoprotein-anchoring transpeptidase ErfK/SrfK
MRRFGLFLVPCVLAGLLVAAPAVPAGAAALPPSVWVIGPHDKVVFITLEGQTNPGQVADVLRVLKSENAEASFFMAGSWIAKHRKLAKKIHWSGYFFGNRGFSTQPFTSLTDDEMRESISRGAEVLNSINAHPAPFLRAPRGERDLRVLNIAGSMGYRLVHWTDKMYPGLPKKVQRRAIREAQRGSIINLDIARKSHRMALPGIIDGLRRRGFSLGSIKRLENVHPVRWDVTFRSGMSGAEVSYLQKILKLRSYPARPTGSFGYETLQATYAFEKAHGLTRDGVVTPAQMEDIVRLEPPQAERRKADRFIEVDISRQVLFEVRDGRTVNTIPISSGNEEQYTVDGDTRTAHTPRGDFTIYRKVAGRRDGDLGTLWWPNYFTGGYAIHGSDSVPIHPASHGCVRIPRYLEVKFFNRNPIGIPVYVHD